MSNLIRTLITYGAAGLSILQPAENQENIPPPENVVQSHWKGIKSPESILLSASQSGNYATAKVALSMGANVLAKDEAGLSAIQVACRHQQTKIVQLLFENYADVGERNALGNTLLHTAILNEDLPTTRYLLEIGIPPSDLGHADASVFDMAMVAENSIKELFQLLMEFEAPLDIQGINGNTALYNAVTQGDAGLVEMFLNAGANPNIPNDQGEFPLLIAVQENDVPLTRLLLDHGANPNITDENGEALLWIAFNEDFRETLDLILEAGVDTSVKNEIGEQIYGALVTEGDLRHVLMLEEYDELALSFDALGHCFEIEGTVEIDEREVRLSGGTTNALMIPLVLAMGLVQERERFPYRLLGEENAERLYQTFSFALREPMVSQATAHRIQEGLPTFINAGWEGHAVNLFFCNGYMAITNTGDGLEGDFDQPLTIYKIDPSKVDVNTLLQIDSVMNLPKEEVQPFLYTNLPRLISPEEDVIYTDDYCALLEEFQPIPQTGGFCTYACKRAAMGATWNLLTLPPGEATRERVKERVQESDNFLYDVGIEMWKLFGGAINSRRVRIPQKIYSELIEARTNFYAKTIFFTEYDLEIPSQ